MPAPRLFYPSTTDEPGVSRYTFAYPSDSGVIAGFAVLEQRVLMHLMATPGSDRYTDDGGGAISVVREFMQGTLFEQTSANIYDSVTRTKQQMLTVQLALDLDPSEELADLEVLVIERTEDRKVRVSVMITSATGEQGVTRL